jgi:hypothetical protein
MFGIIKSALVAVTAYLKFKTLTDLDVRIEKSRKELRSIQEEMEVLRDSGDPYATRRADWLRSDYKAEALHLAYLKTLRPRYPANQERGDDPDAGGDLSGAGE